MKNRLMAGFATRRPFGSVLITGMLLFSFCGIVHAEEQSPRKLTKIGNEKFEAGNFREALDDYNKAADASGDPIPPEILHNQAAAHYKLGEIELARDLWVRAAAQKDAAFEALARYNLGNCDLLAAEAATQPTGQGPPPIDGALKLLDSAIENYRDALRLDPSVEDARANLELAAKIKKQIEDAAQSQPSSQPSPDQQQNDQNQDQNQDQQQSSPPSSQPSSQPQESEGSSDYEQDPKSGDSSQNQDEDQAQSQPSDEREDQRSEGEEEQEGESPQSQPQSSPSEQAEGDQQPAAPIEMTAEQAARLLQIIRDMEQERRAKLRAAERGRQRPVERDW